MPEENTMNVAAENVTPIVKTAEPATEKPAAPPPPPVDSKVTVDIEPSYKNATVSVSAPQNGGVDITFEKLMKELEIRSIIYGIDEVLAHRIVDEKMYGSPFMLARFTPPVNGENGTIEYKFDKDFKPKPKVDETGKADFKELGLVQIVNANTVIAEITKPTPGTPGIDVRKKEIPQKQGDKANFTIGQNISITPDGLRLCAAADGVLRWVKDCFVVESTLTLENVDISTGNVKFIGDVVVRGDVREGLKVHSDKNIIVHGSVSGATLDCLGDITIKGGGVMSSIKAVGEINASFFENCTITTDGNIQSQSFSFCTVYCGGNVITRGIGVIVGGTITCLGNIHCNVVGSKNSAKTEVLVGNRAIFVKERAELQEMIDGIDKDFLQLTQDIKYLMDKKFAEKTLTPDKQKMLDGLMKKRMILKRSKSDYNKRIEEINELLNTKRYHEIVCKNAAYPNVVVRIGEAVQTLTGKYGSCTFTLKEEDGTVNIMT